MPCMIVVSLEMSDEPNIAALEANGYKYIIGAKIRNESRKILEWILEQPKTDCQMVEYYKGHGQRLLVGYTEERARKDAYNREKGIRRLERHTTEVHLPKTISTSADTTSS